MKKLILAVILATVMLTGCNGEQTGTKVEGSACPKITQHGKGTGTNSYYYAVDERTGVVYLVFEGLYRGGITVALNDDGTPVTKEQLESWRSDEYSGS